MKHKKANNKQKELLRLYQQKDSTNTRFKIKSKTTNNKTTPIKQARPLTIKKLLISLLLTFSLVGIQLLISQFIIRKGVNF